MILIKNINKSRPYDVFNSFYKKALDSKQKYIEAIAISSVDGVNGNADSRFVNLKYIINDEWTFFSNYNSPKSIQFKSNENISCLFFWNEIYTQIRIKATIKKSTEEFSDQHYKSRSDEKNALARSSYQSQKIDSYENILSNYNKALISDNLDKRPDYWGGYTFIPHYFEFWTGEKNRLNKRQIFEYQDNKWIEYVLQP